MKTATLLIALSLATPVLAKAPEGLTWQTLDLLSFGFDSPGYKGTPDQQTLARSIWGPAIDSLPNLDAKRKYPAFIIQKVIETPAKRYVFSSFSAAAAVYPACEDAPNGGDANTPIYGKCPMRLIVIDKATNQSGQQDFKDYCHISTNDSDQPKSRNYAQVAVDSRTNTAYYRVVMYGKPVPACDRSIRLP